MPADVSRNPAAYGLDAIDCTVLGYYRAEANRPQNRATRRVSVGVRLIADALGERAEDVQLSRLRLDALGFLVRVNEPARGRRDVFHVPMKAPTRPETTPEPKRKPKTGAARASLARKGAEHV